MRGFSRDSDDGLFPSRILPKEEIKKAKEILGARSLNLVDLYGSYLRKLELMSKKFELCDNDDWRSYPKEHPEVLSLWADCRETEMSLSGLRGWSRCDEYARFADDNEDLLKEYVRASKAFYDLTKFDGRSDYARWAIPSHYVPQKRCSLNDHLFDMSCNYDVTGRDRYGYDRSGYNCKGLDIYGYDRLGFDIFGIDRCGFARNGLNIEGYTKFGEFAFSPGNKSSEFDENGFNYLGLDIRGLDEYGMNINGVTPDGLTAIWHLEVDSKFDQYTYREDWGYTHGRKFKGQLEPGNRIRSLELVGYIPDSFVDRFSWCHAVERRGYRSRGGSKKFDPREECIADRTPDYYQSKEFDEWLAVNRSKLEYSFPDISVDALGFNREGFHRTGYHMSELFMNGTDSAGHDAFRYGDYSYVCAEKHRCASTGEYYQRSFSDEPAEKEHAEKPRYGFDLDGYNGRGFDIEGYDKRGFNIFGLDRLGRDENGKRFWPKTPPSCSSSLERAE